MKRLFLSLLCVVLLLCGCSTAPEDETTESLNVTTTAPEQMLDDTLVGIWVSADGGEREMVETITFGEDGEMSVNLRYEGSDYQTIYGTYRADGRTVFCEMTEGTEPFEIEYQYRINGRELYLVSGEKSAHYLRND